MRNEKWGKVGAVFRQSLSDFPCIVELGKTSPYFGLRRWAGNDGLRFVPFDDEGFLLRGDKRRLVYKGSRRSHRFTVLGDTAFEYDCILNKEPESNVISLKMEGAEKFDFFRQPDFLEDPLLAGSYAVYKKDTLLGEGTGKLCHIHRPEIIDARGRRCWGKLAIIGNELQITVPEQFLSEVKYPVIVDPTIGTTTVGSQFKVGGDVLNFEFKIPVNRFLVSDAINGQCTAYAYVNSDDMEGGGYGVLYSDNGNSPLTKRSSNEQFFELRVKSGQTAGWRSGVFNGSNVSAGSYIWFGICTEYFWCPRFDYGAKCYAEWWDDYVSIPSSYPVYNVNWFEDFKLSMYFTYTSAQNYVCTLTQGVNLVDSRKLTGDYKRSMVQTIRVNDSLLRFETFYRQCIENVRNTMSLVRYPEFIRVITESIKVTFLKWENRSIVRLCTDNVKIILLNTRIHNVIRNITDNLNGLDSNNISLLYYRSVADTAMGDDKISHLGAFIRGLFVKADNTAETVHEANYFRFKADTVQAEGSVFRGLLLFVNIVTQVFIRDYLLGRFLKAKSELDLKSCITVELKLESKIK